MPRSTGKFSAPQIAEPKAGGSMGEIMPFIQQQALLQSLGTKGKLGTSELTQPAVQTAYDSPTGIKSIIPSGQIQEKEIQGRGELIGKTYSQLGANVHAMDLLDQAEKQYREIHKEVFDPATGEVLPQYRGMEGAKYAEQKYINGVTARQDPKFAAFVGRIPNLVSDLQRANSETGNLSMQKELREGRALPIFSPNADMIGNLTMPDDPQRVIEKIHGLKDQYKLGYDQSLQIINSGGVPEPIGAGKKDPTANQQGSQQVSDPMEGKTAVNPMTKQRIVRKGGQWVPQTQTA